MIDRKESKHIIYLDANNLHGYAMSRFLQTNKFKWIDPKDFDLDKYNKNSSKCCVYLKELRKLPIIILSPLRNQKRNLQISIINCNVKKDCCLTFVI